jgi:hypothetical protein
MAYYIDFFDEFETNIKQPISGWTQVSGKKHLASAALSFTTDWLLFH